MRGLAFWTIWPLGLLVLSIVSLRFGVTEVAMIDVWRSMGPDPDGNAALVATYRLPRVAAAMLVGAHFAVAGFVMQIVLRNPLADPTIFGISSGASVAVVMAMTVSILVAPPSQSLSVSTDYLPLAAIPPIALVGGILVTGLVMALAWDHQNAGIAPQRMILNGVILAAILNAVVLLLVLSLAEARTELAILWLAGSLYARGFEHIVPTLPWTLVGFTLLGVYVRPLSLLRFDGQSANALGLNASATRTLLVAVAAGLAASAVAVAGPVGFVGLLAPHIARSLGLQSLMRQIWSTACIGAGLVIISDLVGRIVLAPVEMPVGVVTSLIGAPVFALLLSRRARGEHVPEGF